MSYLAEKDTIRTPDSTDFDDSSEWLDSALDDSLFDEDNLESILTQDEIDSLLGVTGPESPTIGIQALINSSRVTYERLPILEVIFDRFTRNVGTSLRNFTSEAVDVSIGKMDSIRFANYMDSLPSPLLINLFEEEEWGTPALITADAPLVYSVVDLLLGGRKGPGVTQLDSRPYTSIEKNLLERMIRLVLEEFTRAFSLFEPVSFEFKRMETNPRFMSIVPPATACLRVRLNVKMEEGRGGTLTFLIPYSSLEPIRDKLLQMVSNEKVGNDNIWGNHLGEQLWKTHVDLAAKLQPIRMNLNDIMNWKPGDQIIFQERPDSPITLTCAQHPLFTGSLGQTKGHMSVKVTEIRDPELSQKITK